MEDYKQKYKEALERCKKEFNFNNLAYSHEEIKQKLEHIFPELKESEDEKIRKYLIDVVNDYCKGSEHDGCIAWLEKQGEEKPSKVEPKFKVGDWVVYSFTDQIYQVNQIVEAKQLDNETWSYTLEDGSYFSGSWENSYRLWTIQDAKKGDILQANKCTLIFDSLAKDIDDNTVISSWYYCDTKTFYGMGTCKPDLWVIDGVVPATKEQHNLLFQKMKEAGYKWDAEKKELKKIEQKPTQWSEEDETTLACLIGTLTWATNNNYHCSKDIPKYMCWLENLKQRLNK